MEYSLNPVPTIYSPLDFVSILILLLLFLCSVPGPDSILIVTFCLELHLVLTLNSVVLSLVIN